MANRNETISDARRFNTIRVRLFVLNSTSVSLPAGDRKFSKFSQTRNIIDFNNNNKKNR